MIDIAVSAGVRVQPIRTTHRHVEPVEDEDMLSNK